MSERRKVVNLIVRCEFNVVNDLILENNISRSIFIEYRLRPMIRNKLYKKLLEFNIRKMWRSEHFHRKSFVKSARRRDAMRKM